MKIHSMIYNSTTTPTPTNAMKIRAFFRSDARVNSILAFVMIVLLSGCFNESKVDVAKPGTFVRSYSNGYDIETLQVEQTPDGGFIILGNTEVRDSEAEPIQYKIVLVKTDQYGNELGMMHYPAINDDTKNFSASSILLLPSGGYLISGAQIQATDVNTGEITKYKPLIMQLDDVSFAVTDSTSYPAAINARAIASTMDASNNYVVLFSSEDPASSMAVSQINPATYDVIWTRSYAGDETLLAKRIFVETTTNHIIFGGTSTRDNKNDGRLVKIEPNNPFPIFDNPFESEGDVSVNADESIIDICRLSAGYAMIGRTSLNVDGGILSTGDDDILFMRASATGNPLDTGIFETEILADKDYNNENRRTEFETTLNTKNETGKSLSPVSDGGVIILGTIDSYGDPIPLGAGNTDLLLMKFNALGDRQWARTLGGLDADDGTCVRETSDNGFIVLGTTRLGARGTILLVKTDQIGDVD